VVDFLEPFLVWMMVIEFSNKLSDFRCLGGIDTALVRLDMLTTADVVVE